MHPLVHFPDDHSGNGWARLEPGSRSLTQVSQVGAEAQRLGQLCTLSGTLTRIFILCMGRQHLYLLPTAVAPVMSSSLDSIVFGEKKIMDETDVKSARILKALGLQVSPNIPF